MKVSLHALALVALGPLSVACDSAPEMLPPPAGAATRSPAASNPVPVAPVFLCGPPLGDLTIDLPCLVGFSLGGAGGPSAVECAVHTPTASGKVSFIVILREAAAHLGTPLDLSFLQPLPMYGISGVTLQGMAGEVVFDTVDVDGRAFLGRFANTTLTFQPGQVLCKGQNGLFWATPGKFE